MITNDQKNPLIKLKLTGEVKKFAAITPKKAVLRGRAGEKITQTITIVPNTKEPFKILKISPLKGKDFTYSLKEVEQEGKKAYALFLENTKQTPGRYIDRLTILTDRSDQKPLMIMVSGDIRPAALKEQETTAVQPAQKAKIKE